MAPVSDRIYFPSLENCLTGERQLLSWKHIATALSDTTGKRQRSLPVVSFLQDEYVHSLLRNPSSTFAPPNEGSKKDFETKTAPINVPATPNDQYDVKLLKEDAEWLSKNAKVNLVAALRLVVIELQSRPVRYLLGPLSAQDATNLQEAAGLKNGQATAFVSNLGASSALDAEEISAEFEQGTSRRRRLFETFLSERRFFMQAADYATSIKLYKCLPFFAPGHDGLGQLYKLKLHGQSRDETESLLTFYMKVLTDCMTQIESGLSSITDDGLILADDVEFEWLRTLLVEVIHTLSVVFQLADNYGEDFASPTAIGSWFNLMDIYTFFNSIQPINESIAELISPLKTLSAAISINLLKPARSLIYLSERDEDQLQADEAHDSYLHASDVLETVLKSIVNAASVDCESASPVIFAWTLILHRMNVSYQNRTEKRDNLLQQNARENFETGVLRPTSTRRNSAGSIFSIESSKFDNFLENGSTPRDLQLVEQLASAVTANGKVFECISSMALSLGPSLEGSMTPFLSSRIRTTFLELLKVSYPVIGYQAEPLSALMSLFSPGRDYWDLLSEDSLSASQHILKAMLQDDYAMEFYFQQALDRFPYEFIPFVTLCRTLCTVNNSEDKQLNLILALLQKTPTLTFTLPENFQGYELVQEDENTNSFCLLEDVSLISLSSSWSRRYIEDDAYRIPAGTQGRFITDTGRVVLMEYPHSALSLLGRNLEINLMKEGYRSEMGMLQPDEIAEVITLLATLFRMEYLRSSNTNTSGSLIHEESDLLYEASKHISGGKDVVTVICETADYFMQDDLTMNEEAAINVLSACIKFFDAILPVQPSRMWSYLARSELLSSESRAGKLAKITGSLDLVSERFDFLASSLLFFSDLVNTGLSSGVQRRAGNKVASRQKNDLNPWLGTADKVLAKVAVSVARAAVDVFENTATWRFESEPRRASLISSVAQLLNKIILYSYSMGELSHSENLTSCLRPAASYIIDYFLSEGTGALRFQPLLSSFVSAFMTADYTLYPTRRQVVQDQLTQTMELSTTLLRVANYLEKPSTTIESNLFKCSTLLARLCAASEQFLHPAVWLLESLIVNAGISADEPPSLLGYLGPHVSKSFLQLLSNLGRPYVLDDEVKTIWKFFSSILRNRQQWMSNCLLTGQTPREAMKKERKAEESSKDSVFATALTKLKSLSERNTGEALVILDFVASAQNYWPWTVFTLQKDTAYIDGLRAYVRDLKPSHHTVKSDAVRASTETRMAAYIAETFAMQLYHSRHLGNVETLAKNLVADLDYYLRDGIEVSGYNKSLHQNFAKNFASKYFGCSLSNFKRTMLKPRELGENYYYDLTQANEMLNFDPGWLGRKGDGFKNEMKLANANLSLVDAQVALFHAWEFLLLELSTCLPENETVSRQMMQVSHQCLNANQGLPSSESIFVKLVNARANLALVLIQRLVKSNLVIKDINMLLANLVGTINGVEEPFAKESISYYRTLLKALFVTLRAYQMSDGKPTPESQADTEGGSVTVTQTIINLLDNVVSRGFRSLVTLIHDQDAGVCPEDLALITAILQACLSLPNIDQAQTQVLNIMASHDAVNAATSLYSWADQLTEQGDPVYGELSVLFLLELSALPLVAEQLACDGIISNLLSANLTKYMLKTNVSPYADSLIAQRCYAIWVKGFLPLMLNLLASLGATLAPEITYVLNQFPHMLHASVDRFEAPGASRTKPVSSHDYLTLLATSEVHSLALLTRVLAALRMKNSRDIPAVDWDATSLLENVEFWLSSKRLLKERLLPLGQREVEWRNTKTTSSGTGGCDNVLEAKVMSQLESIRDVLSEELDT